MADADSIKRAVVRVCEEMEHHADELTRLDSNAGDGDLGINLLAGLRVLKATVNSGFLSEVTDGAELITGAGKVIGEHAASTFGTLLSQGVIAAGKALSAHGVTTGGRLGVGFRAALDMIKRRGKAEPGDGTMVDALEPAVQAIESGSSASPSPDPHVALASALDAARAGAETTRNMRSTKGRARWSGTQGEGTIDPGALAVVYLLDAMAARDKG